MPSGGPGSAGSGWPDAGDLSVRIPDHDRDPATGLVGLDGVLSTTDELRRAVAARCAAGEQPFLLGGCCTLLAGALAGASDALGTVGLVYVDGHLDFYDGRTSPTGEAADMPVAVVLGDGPAPWVERVAPVPVTPPEAIAILGFRDPTELDDLRDELATNRRAGVLAVDADTIRRNGPAAVAADALDHVRQAADKVWLHIDLDVLDELVFPATDYLIPDGLDLGRADRARPPGRDRPGSHRLVAVVLQPGEGSGWRPRAGHRRRDRAAVRDLTRPIPPGPISSGPDGQAGPSAVHPVRTMRHGLDDDLLVGSSAGAIQEERDMTHETKDEPVVVVAATAGDEAGITAEGVLAVQGNEAVLVAQFADMNAAEAAYEALRDAEINGQIDIDGVLVVNADLDGKIRVKRMSDHTSRNGFLWGAVAGAALAVIFPPSLLAGLVAGGVVGGAVGKVGNQLKKGQVAAELATVITPGTSGIVAVVDITAVDAVKKTIPESKKVEAVPVDKETADAVKAAAAAAGDGSAKETPPKS